MVIQAWEGILIIAMCRFIPGHKVGKKVEFGRYLGATICCISYTFNQHSIYPCAPKCLLDQRLLKVVNSKEIDDSHERSNILFSKTIA